MISKNSKNIPRPYGKTAVEIFLTMSSRGEQLHLLVECPASLATLLQSHKHTHTHILSDFHLYRCRWGTHTNTSRQANTAVTLKPCLCFPAVLHWKTTQLLFFFLNWTKNQPSASLCVSQTESPKTGRPSCVRWLTWLTTTTSAMTLRQGTPCEGRLTGKCTTNEYPSLRSCRGKTLVNPLSECRHILQSLTHIVLLHWNLKTESSLCWVVFPRREDYVHAVSFQCQL